MDSNSFKRQRKQNRQQKVIDDDDRQLKEPSNKRQRRGVSVFQRQLYKRKQWVIEYEAGKDQKRRDRRKLMRGYYRALKDLDREHKKIFGNSISTKKSQRSKQKDRKTHPNDYDYYNNKNENNKKKDVWHELRHPSYNEKYKKSNWNFVDDGNNKNDIKPTMNKRYRGTGVVNNRNYNNNNQNKINDNDDEEKNKKHKTNKKFIGHKLLNSYERAQLEARQIIKERENMNQQKEMERKEKLASIKKFEQYRAKRNKILKMKNRKGQPNLNAQITLLLDKIKNNKTKNKQKKHDNQQNNNHHATQQNIASDNSDVENFLED